MTTTERLPATTTATPANPAPTAPTPRGPASAALLDLLTGDVDYDQRRIDGFADIVDDALARLGARNDPANDPAALLHHDDLQLTLFLLYLLHYGPAPYVAGDWEWDPDLLAIRARIEAAFEATMRAITPMPDPAPATGPEVTDELFRMTDAVAKPKLAMWAGRHATEPQLKDLLVLRSIYTLREADPHSWAIPRLRGRAKAALVEIQSDEYGNGRPGRMHAEIFARTLRAMGLSDAPDAYVDRVPAITLASLNLMSFFGLHRRNRGAIVGHLAAFEMTSSIPNKHYARAFRRLGHDTEVTHYFDEHVEADAVHEQIAGRDMAGALADDEPGLARDIVFGAAASLVMDDAVGAHIDAAWSAGRSALRDDPRIENRINDAQ